MHQWPANSAAMATPSNRQRLAHLRLPVDLDGQRDGQVKFYLDGAQVDQTVDSGTGQTQFSLEGCTSSSSWGTGKGWDMNVDWGGCGSEIGGCRAGTR